MSFNATGDYEGLETIFYLGVVFVFLIIAAALMGLAYLICLGLGAASPLAISGGIAGTAFTLSTLAFTAKFYRW